MDAEFVIWFTALLRDAWPAVGALDLSREVLRLEYESESWDMWAWFVNCPDGKTWRFEPEDADNWRASLPIKADSGGEVDVARVADALRQLLRTVGSACRWARVVFSHHDSYYVIDLATGEEMPDPEG